MKAILNKLHLNLLKVNGIVLAFYFNLRDIRRFEGEGRN